MYGFLVRVEKPQPKRNYNMKFPAPQKKIPQILELNKLFLWIGLFLYFLRLKNWGGPQGLGWDKIFGFPGTCDSGG